MEPRISIITLGVRNLEESYKFYKHGLGFPTSMNPEEGIVFFKTGGVRLALYPEEKLAEDVGANFKASEAQANRFPGITLAHNTRSKEEVVELLKKAEDAGGKIEKEAQDVFWGGFSGYFSDPDGYLWEVAYADSWKFNPDGSLII
jgi:catechol 2,3-dioxygenase-like lactoylglutathione lyase family enzyme